MKTPVTVREGEGERGREGEGERERERKREKKKKKKERERGKEREREGEREREREKEDLPRVTAPSCGARCERECLPSLVQGDEGHWHPCYTFWVLSRRQAREQQHSETAWKGASRVDRQSA